MQADVLVVDAEDLGRRGDDVLHLIVEGAAVEFAHVAGFVDAQDDRAQERVELAEDLLRAGLAEVGRCRSAMPDRGEDRVLADPLLAAEQEGVVELFARPLHAMGEPELDVFEVVGIDLVDHARASA